MHSTECHSSLFLNNSACFYLYKPLMALNGLSCADMLLVGIYSLARCPLRNNQYADCAIQQLQMSINAESHQPSITHLMRSRSATSESTTDHCTTPSLKPPRNPCRHASTKSTHFTIRTIKETSVLMLKLKSNLYST